MYQSTNFLFFFKFLFFLILQYYMVHSFFYQVNIVIILPAEIVITFHIAFTSTYIYVFIAQHDLYNIPMYIDKQDSLTLVNCYIFNIFFRF